MTELRELSAAERVDALAARGVMLYLVGGSLRARCEPEVRALLDAARPALAMHRTALVAYLTALAAHRREAGCP